MLLGKVVEIKSVISSGEISNFGMTACDNLCRHGKATPSAKFGNLFEKGEGSFCFV